VDPGLDPENVFLMTVDLPTARYGTTEEHLAFYRPLLDRVRALPGVVAAAGTTEPPMVGYSMTFSFAIEGRPAGTASGREDDERLSAVTPGYFETLDIPVVAGRLIGPADREGTTPVVVINQALARKQWPDGGAVGSRIQFREGQPWWEIVGVVGDTRTDGLDRAAPPAIYIPFSQKLWHWMSWLAVTVRTEGDPTALAPAIRDEVLALDRTVLPEQGHTLTGLYAESNARRSFATVLLGGFAALALILGAVGVYGVLSYAVAQQTRELGVRIALGAPRWVVARRVVARGTGLAIAGIALGVAAALALSRFLGSLLFGIGARDPTTFIGIPVVLLVVAVAAAYIPARKATRVDPMRALRVE
jgi:predicted permease